MVSYVIHTLIVVALCAGSFYAGIRLADSYHNYMHSEIKHSLRHQFERLRQGIDAEDPRQPFTPHLQDEFSNRLSTDGRATVMLRGRRKQA